MLFIHFAVGLLVNFTVIYTAIVISNRRAELQIKIGRAIQSNQLSINCWFTNNSTVAACYYALIDLFFKFGSLLWVNYNIFIDWIIYVLVIHYKNR